MKLLTVICLLAVGVTFVVGYSVEDLSTIGKSRCQKCLKLLSWVRASTSDSSEEAIIQFDMKNYLCEAECNQNSVADTDLYVSLKDCQTCVSAINRINSHYQGRDANALSSALSFGCSHFDSSCKSLINSKRSELIRQLQHSKDSHTVCRGVHKC